MVRILAAVLLAAFLAGCMGDARGPVELTSVDIDMENRGRQTSQATPDANHAGKNGSDAVGPPDCTAETVDTGHALIARVVCNKGTGQAETTLDGCAAASDEPSWLTLATKEGRLASGNATAKVLRGSDVVATLRVAAAQEDGKEAMLDAASDYVLTVDLDGWTGEWVMASIECVAA